MGILVPGYVFSVGDMHSVDQLERLLDLQYTMVDRDNQPYETARGAAGNWTIHDKTTGQWGLIRDWFHPDAPYESGFPWTMPTIGPVDPESTSIPWLWLLVAGAGLWFVSRRG